MPDSQSALIIANHVGCPDIFVLGSCFQVLFVSKEEIDQHIQGLEDAVLKNDVLALKNIFRKVVQGYQYNQDLVDIVSLQDLENKKA